MPERRALRRAWLLAGACAAGVLLVYLLLVRTHAGVELDQAALDGRAIGHAVAYRAARDSLSQIDLVLAAVGVAAILACFVVHKRRAPAIAAAIVLAAAFVTAELLKRVVFDRPDPVDLDIAPSYPSGHVTVAMATAMALVLVAPVAWRRPVAVVAGLVGAVVSVGVVAAGWHRPSDALGADLIALGWAAAAVAVLARVAPVHTGHPPARHHRHVVLGCGVAALFAAVVVLWRARVEHVNWVDPSSAFLLFAVLLPIAAGLTVAALVHLLSAVEQDSAPAGSPAGSSPPRPAGRTA